MEIDSFYLNHDDARRMEDNELPLLHLLRSTYPHNFTAAY